MPSPSSAGQSHSQPVAGQNASVSRPPMQASGPPPSTQRPPGPVLPVTTGSSSTVPQGMPPPPPHAVRGGELPGQHTGGDFSHMQYFGAQPPTSGAPPLRVGQPPPMGPPPMNQQGVPPQNMPPVNPGPQTMMNLGFAPAAESRPPNFATQGPPMSGHMQATASEMSGPSQFTTHAPPHSQMSSYNYSSQPCVTQPGQAAGSAAGTPLTGPVSQPQPRKLDPDQMPSPVSQCILLDE